MSGAHALVAVLAEEDRAITLAAWEFSADGARWNPIRDSKIEPAGASTIAFWNVSDLEPRGYQVRVTVTDNEGRNGTTVVAVAVDPPPSEEISKRAPGDFCSVESMDVVSTGNSRVATQKKEGGAPEEVMPIVLGPRDTIPANLGAAPDADRYNLYFGVDVVATLADGSKPERCAEIQILRATHRRGRQAGHVRAPRVVVTEGGASPFGAAAVQDCPYDGDAFCLDPLYLNPSKQDFSDGTKSDIKKYGEKLIAWFDGPGSAVLVGTGLSPQELKDSNAEVADFDKGVYFKTHFRAYVLGTTGRRSFQCDWEIDFRVTYDAATGNVTKDQPPRLTGKECKAVTLTTR